MPTRGMQSLCQRWPLQSLSQNPLSRRVSSRPLHISKSGRDDSRPAGGGMRDPHSSQRFFYDFLLRLSLGPQGNGGVEGDPHAHREHDEIGTGQVVQ